MGIFRKKPTHWVGKAGEVSSLCADMLKQPHVLIAGASGSGKSVLINSLIYTAAHYTPERVQLVLIDPKRVELSEYRQLPHCVGYAADMEKIAGVVGGCVNLMYQRFERFGVGAKKSTEADIYIIVDEFADLVQRADKTIYENIITLARLGRAANMHIILATQTPSRQIITAPIKTNLAARIALRCEEAIESRQIIGQAGAELLPQYGRGLYRTPETMQPVLWDIP